MPKHTAKRYETKFTTLEHLLTVEETAEALGMTAARVRQLIGDSRFKEVVQIGNRPLQLLRRAEVEAMATARA